MVVELKLQGSREERTPCDERYRTPVQSCAGNDTSARRRGFSREATGIATATRARACRSGEKTVAGGGANATRDATRAIRDPPSEK
jgi:hypothetical protein